MKEFISIICPTYGRPNFLEEAIYSYLNINDSDSELIILNDYPKQRLYFNHPRVKIFNYDKRFEYYGDKKTELVNLAKGDIIIPLDDDDIILPNYLDVCREKIKNLHWIQQQSTFVYNVPDNIIQLSGTIGLNILFFRKSIFDKVQYRHVNTLENMYLYEDIKKVFPGILSFFSLKDMGYISRWDSEQSSTYHKRLIGTSPNFASIVDNSLNEKIEKNKLSIGDIYLNPQYRNDYISLIEPFIEKMQKQGDANRQAMLAKLAVTNSLSATSTNTVQQWSNVKSTWQKAESFLSAIKSRGVVSTTLDILNIDKNKGERVDDATLALRRLSCFGDNTQPKCEYLRTDSDSQVFCGACGCGSNKLAVLTSSEPDGYTKLHYPQLECPLKKPGFSNFTAV